MKTRKLLKLAYAAQALGRDAFSDLTRLAEAHGRQHAHSAYTELRRSTRAASRSARAARLARGMRHPVLKVFGGVFLGLVAFALVLTALGAVFALLGLVLKVALAVGAVYLLVRFLRGQRRPGTDVLIVPPDYRSPTSRYRS